MWNAECKHLKKYRPFLRTEGYRIRVPEKLDESALAELLPGTWIVAATNFPMWLSGERRSPKFSYGLVSSSPLVLTDDVSYQTVAGEEKHILGKDAHSRGRFVWRGKGLLGLISSKWTVEGVDDEGSVLAIRFDKTVATPAGIDILVREDADVDPRAIVAGASREFGLTPEDFASLSWLRLAATS